MIKLKKEIQGTEIVGEEKVEDKTIYGNTCTSLIQKKLHQWRKNT